MTDLRNVLVFGAARSGVAAANFLARRGSRVVLTDSKSEGDLPLLSEVEPSVTKVLGAHPTTLLENAETIVLSPGIPQTVPLLVEAMRRRIPIISEIELAYRHLRGRVVAITGTNGKSTTTALIGEILAAAGHDPIVAGNIGQALISAIDTENERDYVIELSSFQLETIDTFRADVALLLNITPDHLDRYDSLPAYAAAKFRIFNRQSARDYAIVNAEDSWTAKPSTTARVLSFSPRRPMDSGAWFDGTALHCNARGDEASIQRSELTIEGNANVENALAAWLAARALGVDDEAVRKAFRSFRGLPHRMVLVRELGGVRYINDSKGTNVDAAMKSLDSMPDRRVLLILGGKDKSGEFAKLKPLVTAKARMVLTVGDAASKIEEQLDAAAPVVNVGDMKSAVIYAHRHARSGDVVLLSPACASFDQYRNFEERGAHFEKLVEQLEEGGAS